MLGWLECEGGLTEGLCPALRRHHLEYIACSNVVFGLLDGGFVALVGEIAFWFNIFLSVTKITRLLRKRALRSAAGVSLRWWRSVFYSA